MKHQLLSVLGATALLAGMSSCSQQLDEPLANNGGLTTISVAIPLDAPASRAVPSIPEGYTLRCIMQLVDASGAPIADSRYVNKVEPGSDNVQFTFIAPADGYQGAMFWADYVKDDINSDYLYTTDNLKAVGYNTANAAELFNNPAADAFYGYMFNGNTSVSLERPFTRITFKNADSNYDAYTTVKVNGMNLPTSFNTVNGNTADYSTELASNDLTITDGVWFSTYIFVGNNSGQNLGEGHDIDLTLDGSTNLTISGADIPLTRNYDITALISATAGDVTNITVLFPGDMVDPNAPRDIAPGDYINADGSYTTVFDADKAVGIVYALGNGDTEDGKEVAAYAFALTNTDRVKIADADGTYLSTATLNADSYACPAGPANWDSFVGLVGNDNLLVAAFTKWTNAHKTSGSNLSAWYAPSPSQLLTLVGTLFNGEGWTYKKLTIDVAFPARNEAVYNAYNAYVNAVSTDDKKVTFTHNGTSANFFACDIDETGRVLCVQVNEEDSDTGHTFSGVLGKESNPYLIRPVLTIYK